MRSLALLFCALLLSITAAARADSLADLRKPSSTIPGCINDWGRFGTGVGVAEPTCEGKAALAEWSELAAAINAARDTLANTSNWPDTAAPLAVTDALQACADAADAMTRLYHLTPAAPHDFEAMRAWMRAWLEQSKLPSPASIGDGFRTLAAALAEPGLLRLERHSLYSQAVMFATRERALAAALGRAIERQTDNAVRAAHQAALEAAEMTENGHPQRDTAAITTAAGPQYRAIAQEQTRQLNRSLADHPEQSRYMARTRRAFANPHGPDRDHRYRAGPGGPRLPPLYRPARLPERSGFLAAVAYRPAAKLAAPRPPSRRDRLAR